VVQPQEKRLKGAILLILFLGACTTTPAPVLFDEPLAVKSELRAAVALVSGPVRGANGTAAIPPGTILVPLAIGPTPNTQFNVGDQRAFIATFRQELERLGLVAEALDLAQATSADLGIQLIFAQTQYNEDAHTYVLDVAMEIVGGRKPLLKQYRVISSEGDSTWTRLNTNATEGKAKAAARLLKLLIPDVAAYIRKHRSPTGPAGVDRGT
jgi:hypothetical protein